VIVSAAIESELVGMDAEERMVFLEEMGLHETGLARVIRAGLRAAPPAHLLHRRPQGSPRLDRAQGRQGPEAAGEIHSDMQRGFIRAETIAYRRLRHAGRRSRRQGCRQAAPEGKEYVVQDGDVMHFLHS
jgi:ribosome-binding ATPase YchF (GTP1/OBG family)